MKLDLRCEVCGSTGNVDKFCVCGCDKESASAFLCKSCKEKLWEIPYALPPIPYGWSLAKYISCVFSRYSKKEKQDQEVAFDFIEKLKQKKEEPTMKVSYNGFTGELVKLERKDSPYGYINYLSIYDSEKQATHSFTGVKLEDVKFLGGVVSFG